MGDHVRARLGGGNGTIADDLSLLVHSKHKLSEKVATPNSFAFRFATFFSL